MAHLLSVALLLVGAVNAVPSPASLNSDLNILINNDLQGPSSPNADSGVIVLDTQPYAEASAACQELGEQLWSPELGTASIQPDLDYLQYAGTAKNSSRYWIASSGNLTRVIDTNGQVAAAASSLSRLPGLCTQSAPFSNSSGFDSSEQWQVTVESNNEFLTGFRDRYSFRFLGIRYAPQPERFTYSEPYVGTGGNVSALNYGSQCLQGTSGSEDCLFLNIWTNHLPKPDSTQELKPVMIWIHGGAFTGGTANDPTADGGNLASRGDVVAVNINYRLTTLGFLALNDGETNGNFGLADQINALNWVRENIQDFGGDPDRITIFGQSAGAGSVRALMASPEAVGKFAGAIPLSNLGGINYGTTYSKYYTIEQEVEVAAAAILNATNCTAAVSQVDCLRAVPATTLTSLSTVARYLVVDGKYLTTDELVLNGSALPLRLMMGTTRDDGAAFISFPQTTNQSAYLASAGYSVPPANLFPIPDLENKTLALYNSTARLATDGVFRCIDQATVYAGIENGRFEPNVYYYEFNRSYQTTGYPGYDVCEPPKSAAYPYGNPDGEYFKCHSGELYYVFGNVARQGLPFRDQNDLPFEQFTTDSFTSFARSYDPNPDVAYLKARGYQNTIDELNAAGTWVPSTKGSYTKRILQWPSFQIDFSELDQCAALGLGLDYYQTE